MSNGIDDLLESVSGGDIDHPVFGPRYEGEMDDDPFLRRCARHVDGLVEQRQQLRDALVTMCERLECVQHDHNIYDGNLALDQAIAALKATEDNQ